MKASTSLTIKFTMSTQHFLLYIWSCHLFLEDIVCLLSVPPEPCSPVTHFILNPVIHSTTALFTSGQWYRWDGGVILTIKHIKCRYFLPFLLSGCPLLSPAGCSSLWAQSIKTQSGPHYHGTKWWLSWPFWPPDTWWGPGDKPHVSSRPWATCRMATWASDTCPEPAGAS